MKNILKNINNLPRSIYSSYNKASVWGKMLVFIVLFMLVVLVFKGIPDTKEGFEQNDKFLLKNGSGIYDDFYANVYDYLVFNNLKDEYEVGEIINKTTPSSKSIILDIGCGTGHHVASLGAKGMNIIGIDISPSMIDKAKKSYPDYNFEVADAENGSIFEPDSFTHILSMYFTIYYFKDKSLFFNNCYKWLKPGGYLVVHLVDRHRFDPILPPGNPLMFVSPQRYSDKRITSTKVKFTDFSYNADFYLDAKSDIAKFVEKFKSDKDGKVRKHEHIMYMPDTSEIVDLAQSTGFILETQIDLIQCQYEYQYLYVFVKPN